MVEFLFLFGHVFGCWLRFTYDRGEDDSGKDISDSEEACDDHATRSNPMGGDVDVDVDVDSKTDIDEDKDKSKR